MPPTITDQKSPLTEAVVADFESEIGAALPADYRAFLLANNGGSSDHDRFTVRWSTPPHSDPITREVLDYFRSLGEGALDMRKALRAFSGRVPDGALPVATDPFGNQILLGLAGDHRGRVYFWLHDLPPEMDETDPANLGVVADSFDAFLAGLREAEEE